MAKAALGSCWLELYLDQSCLIGESPVSRKEVDSTVRLQYSFLVELESYLELRNCEYNFHPAIFCIELSLV